MGLVFWSPPTKSVCATNSKSGAFSLLGRNRFLSFNKRLDCGYRLDVVVNNNILLELKSVEKLLPVHDAQLLTYLKLSGIRTGLLINFNEALLKNGIKRIVV